MLFAGADLPSSVPIWPGGGPIVCSASFGGGGANSSGMLYFEPPPQPTSVKPATRIPSTSQRFIVFIDLLLYGVGSHRFAIAHGAEIDKRVEIDRAGYTSN
jgi:hypothetical protein